MDARGSIELYWHHKKVAILYLNNPRARNAISRGMMLQLSEIVDELEESKPLFIVLTSKDGRSFCAGGDLRDVRAHLMTTKAAASMNEQMSTALSRLASLPSFLMAAQEGAAIGGGAELISYCDRIVSSRHSQIGFVHASLGVSPGWGGGGQLVNKVGKKNALQMLLTACKWSAEDCYRIGLIDRIVETGDSLKTVLQEIESLLGHPHTSLEGVLNILKAGESERDVFLSLWGQDAHRKALRMD